MDEQSLVILVIEDDKYSRMLLEIILDEVATILLAPTGQEGIELFKTNHVDLVLLDIVLPDIDGIEVFSQLHALRPEVPIIAQTAHVMDSYQKQFMEQGFSGFIPKPIAFEHVLTTVRKYSKIEVI